MDMEVLTKNNNIFYNILCFLVSENEKLFDRTDTKLYWRTIFHMAILFHHINTSLFARNIDLNSHDDVEIKMLKKYRLGYLTGWNFLFQTTFLFLSVSYDTIQWIDKENTKFGRRLKYIRDVIFCGLVVPITLFVTGMFWTVYWIDRELVFPQVYDKIVPWWFNHCVHTVILVVVAVETLLQPRRRPRDEGLETKLLVGTTVFYAVVYYSIYFIAHRWLYGVFGIMTWWQVCLFQSLIWGVSYVFYRIQFPINRLIHGKNDEEDTETPKSINVTTDIKSGIDNSHFKSENIESDKSHCENDIVELNDNSRFKIDNVELIVSDNIVKNVENDFDKGCSYVIHDDGKFR